MVRKIEVRQTIFCPELTQYVSTSRCNSCSHLQAFIVDGVACGYEDKGSMRVLLDENS